MSALVSEGYGFISLWLLSRPPTLQTHASVWSVLDFLCDFNQRLVHGGITPLSEDIRNILQIKQSVHQYNNIAMHLRKTKTKTIFLSENMKKGMSQLGCPVATGHSEM